MSVFTWIHGIDIIPASLQNNENFSEKITLYLRLINKNFNICLVAGDSYFFVFLTYKEFLRKQPELNTWDHVAIRSWQRKQLKSEGSGTIATKFHDEILRCNKWSQEGRIYERNKIGDLP